MKGASVDQEQISRIINDFLYTGLLLSTPAVVTSLLIGLVVAIFQTVTSIQEQTLTFAPRIVAVAVITGLTLSWTLALLASFTYRMFAMMVDLAG